MFTLHKKNASRAILCASTALVLLAVANQSVEAQSELRFVGLVNETIALQAHSTEAKDASRTADSPVVHTIAISDFLGVDALQQPNLTPAESQLPESITAPPAAPQTSGNAVPEDVTTYTIAPLVPSTQWGLQPVAGLPCDCAYGPCQSGTTAICGVDCTNCNARWRDARWIPWSLFGPGEYVGPARSEAVPTYFLRVNDLITLTYIRSRRKTPDSYHIGVGDTLQVEWLRTAANSEVPLNRELLVQPDGKISLPIIGEVLAAGKTVNELQGNINDLFKKYERNPQITVTPVTVNVGLEDIINAVTSVSGSNGQTQALRVTPEGTIQVSGLGSVYVQGLTLEELRGELEARYAAQFGPGLMISPALTERATSYVFMGGEVRAPGRYVLEGPTTVMQAISLAGGWNNGGNLRQVVVFRRDENWCLKATKIDIRAPFYGNDPCPANDIWLRDNDLVVVPKQRILCAADVIELYFTRGVYAVFPITFVKDFSTGSSVIPVP